MDTKRFILRDWSIRDRCKTYLDTLDLDMLQDKPVEVVIKPYVKKRSIAQNNLMWTWLGIIANHLRDEHGLKTNSDDLKDYFQREFLGHRDYVVTSEDGSIVRLRGTSELNTAEFTEFINRIDVYAASELGLQLPHPADVYYEAMGR